MSARLTDQDHDHVAPGGLLAASGRSYRGGGIPIPLLAGVLPQQVGRPIEDRTGLTGLFDFDLDFSAKGRDVGAAPVAGDPPSISAYWFVDQGDVLTALYGDIDLSRLVRIVRIGHAVVPSDDCV